MSSLVGSFLLHPRHVNTARHARGAARRARRMMRGRGAVGVRLGGPVISAAQLQGQCARGEVTLAFLCPSKYPKTHRMGSVAAPPGALARPASPSNSGASANAGAALCSEGLDARSARRASPMPSGSGGPTVVGAEGRVSAGTRAAPGPPSHERLGPVPGPHLRPPGPQSHVTCGRGRPSPWRRPGRGRARP